MATTTTASSASPQPAIPPEQEQAPPPTTTTMHAPSHDAPPSASQQPFAERARFEEWKRKREERRNRARLEQEEDSSNLQQLLEEVEGTNENNHDEEGNTNENIDTDDVSYTMTAAKRRKLEHEALLQASFLNEETNPNGGGDTAADTAGSVSSSRKIAAHRRKQAFLALRASSHATTKATTIETTTDANETNEANENAAVSNQDPSQHDRFARATDGEGQGLSVTGGGLQERNGKNEGTTNAQEVAYETMDPADRLRRQQENEAARILREASKIQTNALQAAKEVASGVSYTESMPSSWTVPSYILKQGPEVWQKVRDEWHMQVQGSDIPPPLKRFVDMKLPKPVIELLKEKGIQRPTPIQMQGLPVALAGRDMVGIAFTGSGKTLTFSVPMVMAALEAELCLPLRPREGPVGIILAPSRELARQTHELVHELCDKISRTAGYPSLRTQLMIGGESVKDQLQIVQQQGLHCLVATPGRLRDVLKRRAINLFTCRYICLDEADRLIDMGFDEEVGEIMNFFPHQRQTLLFSATFPQKFQDFCRQVLVLPIVVNVGRAGAANLDVIQEVEYVKEEAKIVYLLHCLQKTAPPVIIFCERKGAADDIHEYLLLKGVEAVSIHGGKDQEERNQAIALFKSGKKDVLIATDVAAKGLDFPDIQHVINFDMPSEIENYVHRIGRTGRCGKTGVATTFINKSCTETTLLDLKALLKEAKQRIPPVLDMLEDPREQQNGSSSGAGCSFCGGLGHSIVDCPKIDKDARRVAGNKRDVLSGGGDW